MFSKVIEFLNSFISLAIPIFEILNLVNYFSRPRNYRCINGIISSQTLKLNECNNPLSCDENDLYKDCLKLVNYGDIFFNILICFYMLIGIVANLVEFISIFCKDDDINPIIKCIDFISLAVLTFSKFLFVRIMENVFLFKMVLSILNCL